MQGKVVMSGRGPQQSYFVVRVLGSGEVQFPDKLPDYSSVQFWDGRYKAEKGRSYDWLAGYAQLKSAMFERLHGNKEAEILVVGCGNSEISERLYKDGYHFITNIDFSEVVISDLQERMKGFDDMDYYQMDVCSDDMKDIESNTFELILDKATLDCLLCRENAQESCNFMLSQIERILAPGGTYMLVSSGSPQSREEFLRKKSLNWTVQRMTMTRSHKYNPDSQFYVYFCTKASDQNLSQD